MPEPRAAPADYDHGVAWRDTCPGGSAGVGVGVDNGGGGREAGMPPDEWLRTRTFAGPGADPERVAAELAARGTSVSVVIPALEVAGTIGDIVDAVRERWVERVPLVSELVVIDSRSSDGTARVAAEAGATVVQDEEVLPEAGPGSGKGEAMWKSLACTDGDVVVWLDGDTHGFRPEYVPRLLEPLLAEPEISYVKGFYNRPLGSSGLGGARVTEICARPLLNLFYPALAAIAQPLAGEAAGRRELLERLPFFTGYGVETGLVIDILRLRGMSAMAQVDLGERRQDHQSTAALGRMAYVILQVVMRRLADEGRAPADLALAGPYLQPSAGEGELALRASELPLVERPPMVEARHRVSG